ncbi:tetratricopeptide repeat protein [Rhodoferax lacus]|nr:tetratricopeptide repeat protein [Rhodoferax lacus]
MKLKIIQATAISLLYCTASFSMDVQVGEPASVVVKVDAPKNIQKCNADITLPDGEVIEKDFSSPAFQESVSFTPKREGVQEIKWEGKFKFRGLASVTGCSGSGTIEVLVRKGGSKEDSLQAQAVTGISASTDRRTEDEALKAALKAFNEKKYADAVALLTPLAERNNREAQTLLGQCYQNAYFVSKDYQKSMELYRKAASQGSADAQFFIAQQYQEGQGVPGNEATAAEWFRKSSDAGNQRSQYALGIYYLNGRGGLKQDPAKAAELFQKSATKGFPHGYMRLAEIYESGTGVTKSQEQAGRWYQLAAAGGLKVPAGSAAQNLASNAVAREPANIVFLSRSKDTPRPGTNDNGETMLRNLDGSYTLDVSRKVDWALCPLYLETATAARSLSADLYASQLLGVFRLYLNKNKAKGAKDPREPVLANMQEGQSKYRNCLGYGRYLKFMGASQAATSRPDPAPIEILNRYTENTEKSVDIYEQYLRTGSLSLSGSYTTSDPRYSLREIMRSHVNTLQADFDNGIDAVVAVPDYKVEEFLKAQAQSGRSPWVPFYEYRYSDLVKSIAQEQSLQLEAANQHKLVQDELSTLASNDSRKKVAAVIMGNHSSSDAQVICTLKYSGNNAEAVLGYLYQIRSAAPASILKYLESVKRQMVDKKASFDKTYADINDFYLALKTDKCDVLVDYPKNLVQVQKAFERDQGFIPYAFKPMDVDGLYEVFAKSRGYESHADYVFSAAINGKPDQIRSLRQFALVDKEQYTKVAAQMAQEKYAAGAAVADVLSYLGDKEQAKTKGLTAVSVRDSRVASDREAARRRRESEAASIRSKKYMAVFSCTDPYGAGADSSLSMTLMQALMSSSQAYASTMTSSTYMKYCSNMNTPFSNVNLIVDAGEMVGESGAASYYIVKLQGASTVGVVGR